MKINQLTYEVCLEDAKQFKTIIEWDENSNKTYHAAWRNGWTDKIIEEAGIKRQRVKRVFRTYDKVLEKVKHFPTIHDWMVNDYNSYTWAVNNDHLANIKKEIEFYKAYGSTIYSYEECLEDAKQFNCISTYKTKGKTYRYARWAKWIEDIKENLGYKKNIKKKLWWYEIQA